jgi:hypothetical protein
MASALLTSLILFIVWSPFHTALAASHIEKPQVRPWYRRADGVPASECTNPPRDSCTFYADCLESRYHCGPNGYPIGYGENFCQKFSDNRDELSDKGVKWMLDVGQCLQNNLVPEATGPAEGTTCDSLKTKALASHPRCYVDNGLCSLPPSDWAAIARIVGVEPFIGDAEVFLTALKTAEGCADAYLLFLTTLIIPRDLKKGV